MTTLSAILYIRALIEMSDSEGVVSKVMSRVTNSWSSTGRVGPSSSRVRTTIVRPRYRDIPRKTHLEMQSEIKSTFVQTPDYSIDNVAGYDGVLGKITLLGHLFTPYSKNTIADRVGRLSREEMYVINCDSFDKINSAVVLIGAVIAMVIYFRSVTLNARQQYVFINPEDNNNPEKVAELKSYNDQWSTNTWLMGRTFLLAVPGMIALWEIFKRTSVHRKGFESRQETINTESRYASKIYPAN